MLGGKGLPERSPGVDFACALDLSVEFSGEEDGDTVQPEPRKSDDHRAEYSPRLVVCRKACGVEREQPRSEQPEAGGGGARGDEPEMGMVDVRAENTESRRTRPEGSQTGAATARSTTSRWIRPWALQGCVRASRS